MIEVNEYVRVYVYIYIFLSVVNVVVGNNGPFLIDLKNEMSESMLYNRIENLKHILEFGNFF